MKSSGFPIKRTFEVSVYLLLMLALAATLFTLPDTRTVTAADTVPPEEARGNVGGITEYSLDSTATLDTLSTSIAWGDPNGPHSAYAWPFEVVQMGHAIQSYQNYSSGTSAAYFHHGIDMIAPNGTDVFTRSGGQVVNVENYNAPSDLYWEVAILDPEGYVWQYHHLDKNTIPQSIKDAYTAWKANPTSGGYIPPNTYLGDIVYWTVTSFGYRFNHIHLNILAAGDVYLNTMEFHTLLEDTQAPEIQAIGLLNGDTIVSGTTISGNYGLYVRARDLFLSSVYYLPPYKTEFSLDGGAWTTVWEFKNLPGGASDTAFVNDFYVPVYTKGDYNYRDFYIDLGFTPEGQRAFPTTGGAHNIQVRVWDYNGNYAASSFDWTVVSAYENTTPAGITDAGCATGRGVTKTFNVTDNLILTDVNLGINLSHASRGQLRVTLKSPTDAAATTIINTATDTYDNYDFMVDDASTSAVNDRSNDTVASPYYDRRVGPSVNASLDSFNGKNSLGTWTVFICDNTGGTTGTVNRVKLEVVGTDNSNTAPIANGQEVSTYEDAPVGILLNGFDEDGDMLIYNLTSLPLYGVLNGTPPDMVYIPTANYFGADSFTFSVNDGTANSEAATISLVVVPVNDAPEAFPQELSTEMGSPIPITLTSSDLEQDPLIYAVTVMPLHGELTGAAPNLVYTPEPSFTGIDQFNFKVSDGVSESAEVMVIISIIPINHAPIAEPQALVIAEDTNVEMILSGTDQDGNGLTYQISALPLYGTLTGAAPNLIYTPTQNYFGADQFAFVVNDGLVTSAPALVDIYVNAMNDAPIALDVSAVTTEGAAVEIVLSGSDIDGDVLSYTVVQAPTSGVLDGTAPNLVYWPNPAFTGIDTFTFVVNDGTIASAPATVTITVNPSGPATVFSDNFESNLGWTRNANGTDTATLGYFERANPATVSYYGYKQLGTTTSGNYNLVTGPLAGSSAGVYDLDGGITSMRSPAITLPSGRTLTLSFNYYLAHYTNSSSADYLRVKVIGNSTATLFEELGANVDDDAAWASFSANLDAFAGQTVYLLVEAADSGTASLVEAALDDVLILAE